MTLAKHARKVEEILQTLEIKYVCTQVAEPFENTFEYQFETSSDARIRSLRRTVTVDDYTICSSAELPFTVDFSNPKQAVAISLLIVRINSLLKEGAFRLNFESGAISCDISSCVAGLSETPNEIVLRTLDTPEALWGEYADSFCGILLAGVSLTVTLNRLFADKDDE